MANGKPSTDPYQINLENFLKRLKAFYSNWKVNKSDLWGDSDALAIATPPTSEDLRYLKSSALNIWLLGQKKAAKESVGVDVLMHVKGKSEEGASQMETILQRLRSLENDPVIGYLMKEAPEGGLLEMWVEKMKNSGFKLGDDTNGLSDLFVVKNSGEKKGWKRVIAGKIGREKR